MEAMHVGTLQIELFLPEARSLKDKRQILKSMIAVTRNKFNVAVAEIGCQDLWGRSQIAIITVANDGRHVNRVLDSVLDTLESNPSIQLGEVQLEID